MECPNGSECKESSHQVKTMNKAIEWFTGVKENDLPIVISQAKALNGRIRVLIYNANDELIYKKG